jgi:hypothetical protein
MGGAPCPSPVEERKESSNLFMKKIILKTPVDDDDGVPSF